MSIFIPINKVQMSKNGNSPLKLSVIFLGFTQIYSHEIPGDFNPNIGQKSQGKVYGQIGGESLRCVCVCVVRVIHTRHSFSVYVLCLTCSSLPFLCSSMLRASSSSSLELVLLISRSFLQKEKYSQFKT